MRDRSHQRHRESRARSEDPSSPTSQARGQTVHQKQTQRSTDVPSQLHTCRKRNVIAIALIMKVITAANERNESLPRPQTPCPLVHPLPMRVPKPTRTPATTSAARE